MAYGIKYQGEFDSISEVGYRIEILQKDYTGPFETLQLSGEPVVHNWGPDEPKAPVKGSSLSISYLNKGSHPMELFFSNNDDEFKVIFYQGVQVLFVGFLVQDDIREPMLDFTHEVTLSANDNLGLLKDIKLDKNPLDNSVTTAQGDFIAITVPTENWIYLRNSAYLPVVGTPFTISGHPVALMNGSFTPTVVNVVSASNYNVKTNTFTGDTAAEVCDINGYGGYFNLYAKNSLQNIIWLCLQNTGLELETYVYANIHEIDQITGDSFLTQTFIDTQTFISGEDFLSCHDVLEKICTTFRMTLFQALGRWNIIRWDELKQGTGINGYIYDADWVLTGTTTLDADLLFGFEQDTYPETGLEKTIFRPYQFVKETFNYEQPKYLLPNYDLSVLGALIREYVSGVTTIREYVATSWEGTNGYATPQQRFIRVISDSLDNELDRYLVLKGNNSNSSILAVPSEGIEANVLDKIKVSFSVRTNISQPATYGAVFGVRMINTTTTRYVDELPAGNGAWIPTVGFNYSITGNTNQWNSIEISSAQIPYSGILNIFLAQMATVPIISANNETHYKDIRLEYTAYINDSTKIIGHIHNDLQAGTIKNNEDTEIYMDDSPRNPLKGTLFRNKITDFLQERTTSWRYAGGAAVKIGELITTEQLQWRSIPRTRLDGSFRGLIQSAKWISMLNFFTYSELTGLYFLFGTLQINYRQNKLTCSAWEIMADGEVDVDDTYTFTYIYDAT